MRICRVELVLGLLLFFPVFAEARNGASIENSGTCTATCAAGKEVTCSGDACWAVDYFGCSGNNGGSWQFTPCYVIGPPPPPDLNVIRAEASFISAEATTCRDHNLFEVRFAQAGEVGFFGTCTVDCGENITMECSGSFCSVGDSYCTYEDENGDRKRKDCPISEVPVLL